MSSLTIYRLMVLGLAFLLTAGALQIFWKSSYGYFVGLALALVGTGLVFSKAGNSEDILKAHKVFGLTTTKVLNLAILVAMAIFVLVGINFAVTH